MKKKLMILCLSAMLIMLVACGNNPVTEETVPIETETVSQEPGMSLDEYKAMVSTLNSQIMDESIFLSNVGKYEHNYWKSYNSLPTYGDLDYDTIVEHAMEWLAKKSEASADTLSAAHDEIGLAYSSVVQAKVDGDVPDEISDNISELFAAYDALYLLVTEPSGDIDDFADHFNEYSRSIKNCNSILSTLLDS